MARYIQKISIAGREKWIGWEIDGIGSEIPGLFLAEQIPGEELQAKGVKKFVPMAFDDFVELGAITSRPVSALHDQDLTFRLDALQVTVDRMRARGLVDLPRLYIETFVGEHTLEDPRIEARFKEWEQAGAIEIIGEEDCYLRLLRRFL